MWLTLGATVCGNRILSSHPSLQRVPREHTSGRCRICAPSSLDRAPAHAHIGVEARGRECLNLFEWPLKVNGLFRGQVVNPGKRVPGLMANCYCGHLFNPSPPAQAGNLDRQVRQLERGIAIKELPCVLMILRDPRCSASTALVL